MPDYTAPSSSAIEDNAGTPGLASGITEAEIRSLLNLEASDIVAAVESESDSNTFTDADHSKLNGIAASATAYADSDAISAVEGESTLALSGSVTVATGQTLVSPRLPIVSVSGSTTLSEATHAGRYLICAGNVTLPSTSSAGEHYAILNTTGGNITIGRNSRNINGAGSDFTVATYKGATCIAIGSNNWIVLG